MYKELKTPLNLPQIDEEILAFWKENNVFQKSVDQRPKDNTFVFYEGPPSANGKPGIHHVMSRTVKDLFCRFQSMKGKRVERKAGWDTHGLPIELAVEAELGITKVDIGTKISVEEYNQKCRETVLRYKSLWDDLTHKMGYWVNTNDPYITYENNYIESVWWLLKQLYDKGLMYKGYTIQPFSPAAGTGLSSHELNQPGTYQTVKDTTAVAMFKIIKNAKSDFLFDNDDENVSAIAWTTTPWTLPSNTALTVGPKIKYVKVKTKNPYTDDDISVILAEALVNKWFGSKNQPSVLDQSEPFLGKELVEIKYNQLFDFGNPIEPLNGNTDAFKIISADFVTTEDGTGIVHTAPSFGADDRIAAAANGIGTLTLVNKQGKFIDNVGPFSGKFVKNYEDNEDYEAIDIGIAIKMKRDGVAFNVAKYEHNYPHCWRTDKPILYYPLDSWFVKTQSLRERMSELNNGINWKPASTGTGRFGNWLDNLNDWNLSRSRYWGTPLPIWRSEDGTNEICIGSIQQLTDEIEKANNKLGLNQKVPQDLHRPHIDNILLVSEDGKEMRRELDLIDVWFDSGAMPYAQWHYPFENKDKFERNFPADFIAEGVDQTRGWFYTLHALGTMVFDSVAYKNVVSNGLVQDKDGQKMSKRLGNAIEPFETLNQYGADATRWYMMSNSQPWDNLKFDLKGLDEVRRKFFGTLYNTYSFFALYANIDKFYYKEKNVPLEKRPEIDRWIISLLNSLIKEVGHDYANYEPTQASRKIQSFVIDNLSNWYVRLGRRRFWKSDDSVDKLAAYQTLYTCLEAVSKLCAPIAPFFSDWLYQNLNNATKQEKHISVHLASFPRFTHDAIDKDLEERMQFAQRISSLVLRLRKKQDLRVRQPLNKIMIPIMGDNFTSQIEKVKDLILSEVNVKRIEYLDESSNVIKKKIKPNFKTLGRRLGKHMKAANLAIQSLSQADISKIESEKKYILLLENETFELTFEDFEITAEDIPGLLVASDGGLTIALDVKIDDDLLAEGMARELVNRIQNLRKIEDFNVTDKICVKIENHDSIIEAVNRYGQYIKTEVLANELVLTEKVRGHTIELPNEIKLEVNIVISN